MIALRTVVLLSTVTMGFAQIPAMFPWWDSPIVRDLGLSGDQQRQIRATVEESRDRLSLLRNAVQASEEELSAVMNEDPVDPRRAEIAIEKVVSTRSDLTRAVSQMGLRLRLVLTSEQWKELQSRQPGPRRFSRPVRPPGRGQGPPGGPRERPQF